jgi:hypothetical protein
VAIVEEPPDFAASRSCGDRLDWASRRTVTVEVVAPSAVTDGAAETVDCAAMFPPTVKLTAAVWLTVTESVTSVAVYVVDSATASWTVKVATPEPLVEPETVVIVEEPPDFARLTVLRRPVGLRVPQSDGDRRAGRAVGRHGDGEAERSTGRP